MGIHELSLIKLEMRKIFEAFSIFLSPLLLYRVGYRMAFYFFLNTETLGYWNLRSYVEKCSDYNY